MSAQSKVRAIAADAAPSPLGKPEPVPVSALRASVNYRGKPLDLSGIMRSERIATIHRDKHLDRFSVTLTDGSMGLGASVGEALADAHRRAA